MLVKKLKFIIFASICALFFSFKLTASDKILFYYGPYLGYVGNIHDADFQSIPGCLTCGNNFASGFGSSFGVGAFAELPLSDIISAGIKLGYSNLNGQLSESSNIGNVSLLDPATNKTKTVSASVDHVVNLKAPYLGLEPYLDFQPVKSFHVNVGLKLAILTSSKFDQYEELTTPVGYVFETGKLRRNEYLDKDVPGANSLQIFGVFGFSYDLKIGKDQYLCPEIQYFTPFTNINSLNWKVSQFQIGAKLKLPIYKSDKKVVFDTIFKRDTTVIRLKGGDKPVISLLNSKTENDEYESDGVIVQSTTFIENYEKKTYEKYALKADLEVYANNKQGKKEINPNVVIEEIETEETFPVLPYVFFKEGGDDLTNTGQIKLDKPGAKAFDYNSLNRNSLKIYANMLNLIGYRLKNNPKAEITITGCNNDSPAEKDNLTLSENRALAVKNYLVSVWEISNDRIKILKRGLPAKPANPGNIDGAGENSRVEIVSSDYAVTAPVSLKDIVKQSNPPTILIKPTVNMEAGLANYKCEVSQSGKILRTFTGDNNLDLLTWNIENEPIPVLETPVQITFSAKDKAGNETSAYSEISIKQKTIKTKRETIEGDYKVERFSLILFDFNQSEILPNHIKILNEIKGKITPNSIVSISGYADRTGTPDYNRDLAKRRCEEVQKILNVAPENLTTKAIGSDDLIFDNNIPEGRNYCRTVKIEIRTPIKK